MSTRAPIEIKEWESVELELSTPAARTLSEVAGTRLNVGMGTEPGTWKVAATSHVGTFVTPEVELLVHPKVPMHNLFQMLDVGAPAVSRDLFGFKAERSLLAALAQLVARSIDRTVANGLLRSYRPERARLNTLRGRVDIAEVVRRPGLAMPVPCAFDEYTADIGENRALRAAVQRLLRVPGVRPPARRLLTHVLAQFEEVSDAWVDADAIDRIHFTRLNRHYRQPLRLSALVLRNLSLIDRVGSDDASSFTIDMNVLFQEWVTDRLRRHLRGRLSVVAEPTEHLAVGPRIPMYPDLTFQRDGRVVYVGDVKYKLTWSGLARNADYYQVLAYATVLRQREGILVYCQADGSTPDREVTVRGAGTVLRTVPLDLSGSPDQMEQSVRDLADQIAGWAGAERARGVERKVS